MTDEINFVSTGVDGEQTIALVDRESVKLTLVSCLCEYPLPSLRLALCTSQN